MIYSNNQNCCTLQFIIICLIFSCFICIMLFYTVNLRFWVPLIKVLKSLNSFLIVEFFQMTDKCSKKDEEISHLRVQLKQVILQVGLLYFCMYIFFNSYTVVKSQQFVIQISSIDNMLIYVLQTVGFYLGLQLQFFLLML